MANLAIQNETSKLTIAHIKSSTPDYRVEDAEIDGARIKVSYYDENGDPTAECENIEIPVKDVLGFIEDLCLNIKYVRVNTFWGPMEEDQATSPFKILEENTTELVQEFMNKGGFSHGN